MAVWMLAGNLAFAAARFALLMIIAKLGSQVMLGQYRWAVASCLPIIIVCRFGARTLLATDARDELPFNRYLAFSLTSTLIGLATISGILYLWPPLTLDLVRVPTPVVLPQWLVLAWPEIKPDIYLIGLVLIVAVWNSLESIGDLFIGLFQRYERMNYIARAYALQAVLICILVATALLVTRDIRIAAVGLVLATLARLVGYEMPTARRLVARHQPASHAAAATDGGAASIYPIFERSAIRRLLTLGTPLAIVTFALALNESIPVFIIRDKLGEAALGAFAALFALATAQNLLITSLSQSLNSRLSILFVQKDRAQFVRVLMWGGALAAIVGCLGFLVVTFGGKQLLSLLFSPKYAENMPILLVLILYGVAVGVDNMVGTAVTSMRRFAILVPLHAAKLAITYFGCLAVAGTYGLSGVSWVLVGASLFSTTCHAALIWWAWRQS